MKTARFLKAVEETLFHEGSYNNRVTDKGGATNWGVSLRFLKAIKKDCNGDGRIDWLDIKGLSKENAIDIYWLNFWRPIYDVVPARLGAKVFDTAVNAGHARAHKLLQQTLNQLGSKIKADGLVGNVTLSECAKYAEADILKIYCVQQKSFYDSLVKEDPSQVEYIKGWTNRAKWLPK
jgi:lysozyme family protein